MAPRRRDEGFQKGGWDYAAYLEPTEGRLRTDLGFANLQGFRRTSQTEKTLHALDVGSGTRAVAARLALLDLHVTQLDSSRAMLDIAKRTADEAGFMGKDTVSLAMLAS